MQVLDAGLDSAVKEIIADPKATRLLIACPFISSTGASIIVDGLSKRPTNAAKLRIIFLTKFELLDFVCGASDLGAIRQIFNLQHSGVSKKLSSVTVYGLTPSLHTKLILTNKEALVGSANLTGSALQGGNAELYLRLSELSALKELNSAFLRLADKASVVDESFLKQKESQLKKLQKESKDWDKLRKSVAEFQAASKLCRLPVQSKALAMADYYQQLVVYLKWINSGNGTKTKSGLTKKIADSSQSKIPSASKLRTATLRVEFLKSIGIIKYPTTTQVSLTPFGKQILANPAKCKRKIFHLILKWCEVQQHDLSLRQLMRPIAELKGAQAHETIGSLYEKLGRPYPTKDAFSEATSPSRNWLVSLDVLTKVETVPVHYKRGKNFPTSETTLDATLNKLIGIEDPLQWLKEEQ